MNTYMLVGYAGAVFIMVGAISAFLNPTTSIISALTILFGSVIGCMAMCVNALDQTNRKATNAIVKAIQNSSSQEEV